MNSEICITVLGRSLIFCCMLSATLFHDGDAVVENKMKANTRDHRVTLIQRGIVPGIVDDVRRSTSRRILSPSSPLVRSDVTTSPTTTTTTKSYSKVSTRSFRTARPNERQVQPSPAGKRTAARNDCCVVGQAYALTNMSCDFTTASDDQRKLPQMSKGSEVAVEGRVRSTTRFHDMDAGRVTVVGRRVDRMLRKCLANHDLEAHLKKCCWNDKREEAIRKCRLLNNARQRRLCRMDANRKRLI